MTSTGSAPEIVFRGVDGTEAEEFIATIERLAFIEGWSKDRERMLLLARSCLRHKALRWFARLDPSKKNDWDLFVEALFDQYPLVEAPTEAEISTPVWSATTFSPGVSTAILPLVQDLDPQTNIQDQRQAPGGGTRHSLLPVSRAYDPSIPGGQLGILRVVIIDGPAIPHYVWRGPTITTEYVSKAYPSYLRATIDRHEALVVCFKPSPEPHLIGCLNATCRLNDLSLGYSYHSVSEYGLYVTYDVRIVNKNQDISTVTSLSKVWNVLSDGSLEASLPVYDQNGYGGYSKKEDFKTSEVHVDTSNVSVRFVKPGTPLIQDDPKRRTEASRHEFKARIVFEPL